MSVRPVKNFLAQKKAIAVYFVRLLQSNVHRFRKVQTAVAKLGINKITALQLSLILLALLTLCT